MMNLQQSDPPGNIWKKLHQCQHSSKSNRRKSMPSREKSGHASMIAQSGTPRLDLLLNSKKPSTKSAGEYSIPRTVSTSSCTESDDDSSVSLSQVHELCDHSRCHDELLERENTLATDAWNDVAYEYHRRVEPFTSQFLPFLLNRNFLVERKGRHVDGTSLNYLNGKHVLDVATGTGAAALYAASKGAKVTATDFSEEMLKIADA
eukprot:scaffold350113_cov73-Cyclotella_meneghiniana.AAC.2